MKTAQKSFTFDIDRTIYSDLIQYVDVGGVMVDRITAIGAYHVFEPLVSLYITEKEDHEKFNQALFYILYLYSKESEKLSTQLSYLQIKGSIAEQLRITDKKLYADLIELREQKILDTVINYLEVQTSKIWEHLTMLREQYHIMLRSSVSIVNCGEGGTDFEQMRKNAKHAGDLFLEIKEWEQRLAEEERILKEGHLEVQRKQRNPRRRITSLRIENLAREVRDEDKNDE